MFGDMGTQCPPRSSYTAADAEDRARKTRRPHPPLTDPFRKTAVGYKIQIRYAAWETFTTHGLPELMRTNCSKVGRCP